MSRKKSEKKMFSDVGDKLAEIEQESHCPANCSIGWVYWVRLLRSGLVSGVRFRLRFWADVSGGSFRGGGESRCPMANIRGSGTIRLPL